MARTTTKRGAAERGAAGGSPGRDIPGGGIAGRSARERGQVEQARAMERRQERDALAMAVFAALPLFTYVLIRIGVSRLESVGIAAFAAVLLAGWRRGAARADHEAASAWHVGASGEEATAAALDRVGGRGVAVFHDVRLPGRRENIDHVVIARGGVAVIESKRWSGTAVVGRHVRVGGARRDEVLDQVVRLRSGLSRHLGVPVAGFVCVHGARVRPAWFRRRARIGDVRFGGPDDMVRWMRRRRRTLSAAEVDGLAGAMASTDRSPIGGRRPG